MQYIVQRDRTTSKRTEEDRKRHTHAHIFLFKLHTISGKMYKIYKYPVRMYIRIHISALFLSFSIFLVFSKISKISCFLSNVGKLQKRNEQANRNQRQCVLWCTPISICVYNVAQPYSLYSHDTRMKRLGYFSLSVFFILSLLCSLSYQYNSLVR